MAVGDAHVFPGFLTPVLPQLFFLKPLTTFLTCFCRGERQKYTRKKVHLNRGSNSQSPGQKSNTLTNEPPRQGTLNLVTRKGLTTRNTHMKYESSTNYHSKVMEYVNVFCRQTNKAKTVCPYLSMQEAYKVSFKVLVGFAMYAYKKF